MRYGDNAVVGYRWTDPELVSKDVKARLASVGRKAVSGQAAAALAGAGLTAGVYSAANRGHHSRVIDPETDRQRRQGMAIGAAGLGGGLQVRSGVRQLQQEARRKGARKGGVFLTKPAARRLAVGGGLLGAAGAVQRHSVSERNRRWQ